MLPPVLSIDTSLVRSDGTSLIWGDTTDDNGDPLTIISQYLLYSDDSQSVASFYKVPVSGENHTLLDVVDGTTYLIKLVQEIASGLVYSNILSVYASSKPSPPSIQSIVGIDNGMTINLSYASDGASVMSKVTFLLADSTDIFTIEKDLVYQAGQPAPTSFDLLESDNSAIVNGASFEIACFTTNSRGDSAISNAMLGSPSNLPDSPQSLATLPPISPEYWNQSIWLSWSDPADFSQYSSDSTLQYEVQFDVGASGVWTSVTGEVSALPSPRQLKINSLSNGVSTQFKIRYINSNGIGAWSSIISATPFNISSGVVAFTAVDGNEQISFSWAIPTNLGGLSLDRYYIMDTTGNNSANLNASRTSYVWDSGNFINGSSYNFSLTPVTIDGNGVRWNGQAVYFNNQIPYTVPDAPTNLQAVASNQSVTLSWVAPPDNGRSITGYKVSYTFAGITSINDYNAELSQTIYTLTNGTSYSFKVQALNEAGYGDWSDEVSAIPFTPPSEPLNFSVVAGDTQITASWSPSQNTGGYAITQYAISSTDEFGSSSSTTVLASEALLGDGSFSKVLSDMVNGVSYTLKVKAVTDVAQSEWTPVETVIPFGQPIVNSVVASGKTLTAVVAPNGRKIIEYHALAIDSDPSPDDVFFIEQAVDDDTYSGTVTYSIPFALSGDISKYLFFVSTEQGNSAVNTNFAG
jgi:hypothetical protein